MGGILSPQYTISQTPVYEFKTPVYEFADTGIRVRKHRYTSSQTPVYEFADTESASSRTPEARVKGTIQLFWILKGHFHENQGLKGPDSQKSMLKGQFNFFGS